MRKMRDVMSLASVGMAPGDSVSAAAQAMKRYGVGTVPVGVVSIGDLALEKDATSVPPGVSSAAPNS